MNHNHNHNHEMEEESVGNEHRRDRLSELPMSLILLILSFLPMRDVVSTTLLSRRWNNLWTSVPCLNFINIGNEAVRVRNFVNRALMLWRGTKILKFQFHFLPHFDMSLADDIDLWVSFAVKYKVEELSIHLVYKTVWLDNPIMSSKNLVYTLPQCLNLCSSLRKLSLVGCNLRDDVPPLWNHLRMLILYGFCFGECLIERIMLGSPRLSVFELNLMESYENLKIRSASLKRLKIGKYLYSCLDVASDKELNICCPNLEALELLKIPYRKFSCSNAPSLTYVKLGFFYESLPLDNKPVKNSFREIMRQILTFFRHVEHFSLTVPSVEVLCTLQRKRLLLPVPSVKTLELTIRYDDLYDIECGDLMNLLGLFPKLSLLFIGDLTPHISEAPQELFKTISYFENNLSKSSLLRLKTVLIMSPLSTSSMFRTVALLLSEAVVLEKFEIMITQDDRSDFPVEVVKRLRNMPRSSPTVSLMVASKYDIVF